MGSEDNSKIQHLIDMFPWKSPLLYLALAFSIVFYWYYFYKIEETVVVGLLRRSMSTKVFFFLIATTLIFLFFCYSDLYKKSTGLIPRALIVCSAVIIWICILTPAWSYNKYDSEKMSSYIRFLPFGETFSLAYGDPLYFNNINKLEVVSGGDSADKLRFYLKNGEKRALSIQSISNNELRMFYKTIYQECEWLRDDIDRDFSRVLRNEVNTNEKEGISRLKYGLGDLLFPLFIWLIILEFVKITKCVIKV